MEKFVVFVGVYNIFVLHSEDIYGGLALPAEKQMMLLVLTFPLCCCANGTEFF